MTAARPRIPAAPVIPANAGTHRRGSGETSREVYP